LLQFSLVRAIRYLNPSTVAVDQAFTVTWLDPPQESTQFGVGIPHGGSDDIKLDDLVMIDPAGHDMGTLELAAPSTTG